MRKKLLLLLFIYSVNASAIDNHTLARCYIDILSKLYKDCHFSSCHNDSLFYNIEEDSLLEKQILIHVKNKKIKKAIPSEGCSFYAIFSPTIEKDSTIVFPVRKMMVRSYVASTISTEFFLYRKCKNGFRRIATISEEAEDVTNADAYLDQYAEILESLSKARASMNDTVYYIFNTDSIMEKLIDDITPPYILNDLPPNGESLYMLNPPHIQKDGSVVFNVGLAGRSNCNIIIGGTETFVFKKTRRKLRLISVIESGI